MSVDLSNIKALEQDLIAVVAKHASWLSGKEFQQAAALVAQGYFAEDDLDRMLNVNDFLVAAKQAMDHHFGSDGLAQSVSKGGGVPQNF